MEITTDMLKPQPVEELIKDLDSKIHEAEVAAYNAVRQEEERSRQWCVDRMRRMEDETRPMRALRDQTLNAWSAAQEFKPSFVSQK